MRLDGVDLFVIWYTADSDGFVRAPGGRVVVADTAEALGVASASALPAAYDFDRVQAWCDYPNAAGLDCRAFLDAWNFLDDLTGLPAGADTPYTRLSRAAVGCYDKLFWGTNLPAVTPPGGRFDPAWTPAELAAIRSVFTAGLPVLRAELAGNAPGVMPSLAADGSTPTP